jgi:hypothetical protein
MPKRIEWRSRAEGFDALVAVEDGSNAVLETWDVDPDTLTEFLNDMTRLGEGHAASAVDHQKPEDWGELVIARTESGDVAYVDPELYWGGVAYWFRSRGSDPHLWRYRH